MLFNSLNTNERILIRKCSEIMISSLTRLASDGNPIFDDLLDSYTDLKPIDIDVELIDNIILWEGIRDNPEDNISKLSAFDILIMRMVLLEALQPNGVPKSTKKLVDRLDNLLTLSSPNQN